VKEGNPAKEIVQQAEGADLLVMGTHGRSGFERLFLGSVTEKVLRTTDVRC
jgi:nucleotide-binding universal stress UspA family protein